MSNSKRTKGRKQRVSYLIYTKRAHSKKQKKFCLFYFYSQNVFFQATKRQILHYQTMIGMKSDLDSNLRSFQYKITGMFHRKTFTADVLLVCSKNKKTPLDAKETFSLPLRNSTAEVQCDLAKKRRKNKK